MNAETRIAYNDIAPSENTLEDGLKFVDILKKTVISDLVRPKCKPLVLTSQLHDVHCYTDPFMAGDHSGTMLMFMDGNSLSVEDDEPSRADSNSERTGLRSDFSWDDSASKELPEYHARALDLIAQRLVRETDAWQAVKPCTELARKCSELLRLLNQDLIVADLKITLFITACNNVKVKPFPDHVVDETPDGMVGLVMVNNFIPPVEILKFLLEKKRFTQLNEHVINITHWLMVQLRQPKLITLPKDNYDSVFDRIQYATNLQRPNIIIKIMVNNLSSNYLQWQASKGQLPTKFAFYGARVEHIHSLVHLGLYPFQKVAGPKGRGIYLTTDLKTCLDTSPPSWVWGKSTIGTQLQTIAVVEFIDRSSKVVTFRDHDFVQQPGQGKPYQYYISNPNLIQARYLLIFVKDSHNVKIVTNNQSGVSLNQILIGGMFIGSYMTLCYVAWKTLRSTNDTFWDIMLDKFKNVHVLDRLPQFVWHST